jgi:tetratricopeptide (TPR) repeat protein
MGRVCRAYRLHRFHRDVYGPDGISQKLMGQWLGLTQAQVSRVENGPAPKNLDTRTHWACVLRVPAELLWFDLPGRARAGWSDSVNHLFDSSHGQDGNLLTLESAVWTGDRTKELSLLLREGAEIPVTSESVTHLVHQWLVVEPPQLVEVRTGRHIGESLVSKVERRVAQLRRMDDFVAGGDLHELVERELRATAALLRDAAYTEQLGRRLLIALSELCQLTGWVTGDAGLYALAAHYYSVGVKAGHAAGDTALAANLISTLAYQVSNVGNRREAILLAQTAVTGAQRTATPKTKALIKERVAWAHARVGDRVQTERALAAVEREFSSGLNPDDPEWVYWLTEQEIQVMAGRCYVELGMPERAVPLLSGALAHYDERMTRELALYTSWLAEARIGMGEVEAAVGDATRTLELTEQTSSARSDDRVKLLRRKLQPYKDLLTVREFEELVRAEPDDGR